MAMRILVTGRNGQVTQSLQALTGPDVEIVALGRPEFDLADPSTIARAVEEARPDIVVSAAAYTAVDKAESEEDAARAVNAIGPGLLARAAAGVGAPVIHLSTDYVFAGDLDRPYREDDATGPQGAYGRTKLAGEEAVLAAQPNAAILRTAWVYSPYGANFLKTMLRLAGDRDELRVVADQHGTPTYAPDIADGILAVARAAMADRGKWRGVFHMVATGETDWAGFAEEIFAQSKMRGGPSANVVRIGTADYPTPAKRPANSRLSTQKFETAFGTALPDWQDGVGRCLDVLGPGQRG